MTPPPSREAREAVKFEPVLDSIYGHRAVLYGPGGIGKSTLGCLAPGPVGFFDLEEALEKIKSRNVESGIAIPSKVRVSDWLQLRGALRAPGYEKIKTVIVDSGSVLEQWAVAHTIRTVKKESGGLASSIEDYGFGKGYRYVYETFLQILGDLDAHARAGRNVILICHDDAKVVPNPQGIDFLRWEPKLQDSKSCSIRARVKEWADHVLFLAYDINVEKSDDKGKKAGKAQGSGTRSLYTAEQAWFMAKSRTTCDTFDIEMGFSPWDQIFK